MSLYLYHEGQMIYHFNFRFDYNVDGTPSVYIGTIQGSKHGLETTKVLTKKLFGYRPKNFILYLMRIFVQTLGIHDIYVITDEGFYTNSHMLRGNRSKKTNFNEFWIGEGAAPDGKEPCITTCRLKKDGANTAKSSRRSATFSASAISSWTPSSHRTSLPSRACSARASTRYRRPSTKRLLQINRLITTPSKHRRNSEW